MDLIRISKITARRFVLGRQGLWPGRRWKGKRGTVIAMKACEVIQLDPLNVVAHSQDLVLHARVLAYKPEYMEQALYKDRELFDYGGWLAVYPISELPYWRLHMKRRRHDKRVEDHVLTYPNTYEQVRKALRARGPLGNRDLEGRKIDGWNYRGHKDTSLVLFHMWLSGELMIHHRQGFQRYYDFLENVAPGGFQHIATERESEEYFARKAIAMNGIIRESRWKNHIESFVHRTILQTEVDDWLGRWMDKKIVAPLQIGERGERHLVLAEDLPLVESIEKGHCPKSWKPIGPTTREEVTFLSPLDIVSARGRAKKLFDFDYVWEVYKPAPKRRWGYYTLPILYGDDLVARLDPKMDRKAGILRINGFWLEDDAPVNEPEFASALAGGLVRLARFLEAERFDLEAIRPLKLRRQLKKMVDK